MMPVVKRSCTVCLYNVPSVNTSHRSVEMFIRMLYNEVDGCDRIKSSMLVVDNLSSIVLMRGTSRMHVMCFSSYSKLALNAFQNIDKFFR